jgi:hypothetical protein
MILLISPILGLISPLVYRDDDVSEKSSEKLISLESERCISYDIDSSISISASVE